jgi:transcriptional regulator of arginine metabolism
MLSKEERLFAIREIIATGAVRSQDELGRLLKRRGASVTQATLSRDMREIGVVRVGGADGGRYTLRPADEMPAPSLASQVVSIVANESMVVVHTLSGSASIIAEIIDRLKSPRIIGTVAGDNTVLVVPRSAGRTPEVIAFLKTTLIKGLD